MSHKAWIKIALFFILCLNCFLHYEMEPIMSIRAERKIQSRQAIIEKVLLLSYNGQPFHCMSLRELAREVGIVPSALYRHFANKDVLAQAAIDQVTVFIKSALFQSRARFSTHSDETTEVRLETLFQFVEQHSTYWHFFISERWGNYPILEKMIHQDIFDLTRDLVSDLKKLEKYQNITPDELYMFAELLLEMCLVWSKDWINLCKNNTQESDKKIFLKNCLNRVLFMQRTIYL